MTRATDERAALRRLEKGFDRLSAHYEWLSWLFFAGAIQRSQRHGLQRVSTCRRALIVGGGSGRFLNSLLQAGFRGSIDYVDLSPRMLRRSRRLVERQSQARFGRIRFVQCDVRELADGARYDVICTNYFLDLFEPDELRVVMRRLDRVLCVGGLWVCSDFAPPEGAWPRRVATAAVLRTLYLCFGVTCGVKSTGLPPIRQGFAELGYRSLSGKRLACGLLWSALFERARGGLPAQPLP